MAGLYQKDLRGGSAILPELRRRDADHQFHHRASCDPGDSGASGTVGERGCFQGSAQGEPPAESRL